MTYVAVAIAASTAIQVGAGAIQAGSSRKRQRQAELETLAKQSPLAKPSKPVNEYYQQALNKFTENPYQSQEYMRGVKDINQMIAQNINAAQTRGAGIGGIGKINAAQQAALSNLQGRVYGQKAQQFGQLGQATQMKQADENRLYQLNEKNPYDTNLALKQMQAAAAAQQNAAGWQTMANAASNLGTYAAFGGLKGAKSPKVKGSNLTDLQQYDVMSGMGDLG